MKNQDPIIVVVKELQKLVLIVKEMELRLQKIIQNGITLKI